LDFGKRLAATQTLEALDNAVFIGEPTSLFDSFTGTTMTFQTCLSRQGKLSYRSICQDVRLTQFTLHLLRLAGCSKHPAGQFLFFTSAFRLLIFLFALPACSTAPLRQRGLARWCGLSPFQSRLFRQDALMFGQRDSYSGDIMHKRLRIYKNYFQEFLKNLPPQKARLIPNERAGARIV
jgi:hypothetical protein